MTAPFLPFGVEVIVPPTPPLPLAPSMMFKAEGWMAEGDKAGETPPSAVAAWEEEHAADESLAEIPEKAFPAVLDIGAAFMIGKDVHDGERCA